VEQLTSHAASTLTASEAPAATTPLPGIVAAAIFLACYRTGNALDVPQVLALYHDLLTEQNARESSSSAPPTRLDVEERVEATFLRLYRPHEMTERITPVRVARYAFRASIGEPDPPAGILAALAELDATALEATLALERRIEELAERHGRSLGEVRAQFRGARAAALSSGTLEQVTPALRAWLAPCPPDPATAQALVEIECGAPLDPVAEIVAGALTAAHPPSAVRHRETVRPTRRASSAVQAGRARSKVAATARSLAGGARRAFRPLWHLTERTPDAPVDYRIHPDVLAHDMRGAIAAFHATSRVLTLRDALLLGAPRRWTGNELEGVLLPEASAGQIGAALFHAGLIASPEQRDPNVTSQDHYSQNRWVTDTTVDFELPTRKGAICDPVFVAERRELIRIIRAHGGRPAATAGEHRNAHFPEARTSPGALRAFQALVAEFFDVFVAMHTNPEFYRPLLYAMPIVNTDPYITIGDAQRQNGTFRAINYWGLGDHKTELGALRIEIRIPDAYLDADISLAQDLFLLRLMGLAIAEPHRESSPRLMGSTLARYPGGLTPGANDFTEVAEASGAGALLSCAPANREEQLAFVALLACGVFRRKDGTHGPLLRKVHTPMGEWTRRRHTGLEDT
jgi:hypothetical protein